MARLSGGARPIALAGSCVTCINSTDPVRRLRRQGSMFCSSGQSCHLRYGTKPYFMSSNTWATEMAQYGMFNTMPSDSAWAQANRVYGKYCSSDLWSGDMPSSSATWDFAFRGARIARAIITSLVADYGMGSTPGERLLFGGCSAGAIGAMNNLDAVAAMAPAGMQVQGLLDAASLIDIRPSAWPFSNELLPLQTQIAALVTAIQPTFEPNCAARYTGAAAWKCLLGGYRMPLLTTPFFANMPQIDDFEIQYDSECVLLWTTHLVCLILTTFVRCPAVILRHPRRRSTLSWPRYSKRCWRSSPRCRPAPACSARPAWCTACRARSRTSR